MESLARWSTALGTVDLDSEKNVRAVVDDISPWNPAFPTKPAVMQVNCHPETRSITVGVPRGHVELHFVGLSRETRICFTGKSRETSKATVLVDVPVSVEMHCIDLTLGAPAGPPRRSKHEDILCDRSNFTLMSADVVRIRVSGNSLIDARTRRVGALHALGRPVLLTFEGSEQAPISRIEVSGAQRTNDGPDLVLVGNSRMYVESLENASVALESPARLKVTKQARDSVVRGQGHVEFAGLSERIRLQKPVRLSVLPHATALELSGSVVLGDVAHATLAGGTTEDSPQGLVIAGLEKAEGLERCTISGFSVPVESQGLEVLSGLRDHALQASPHIHSELPGWHRADRRWLARRHADRSVIVVREVYAQEMAALAAAKATSGAVRTHMAWCAYRMRNIAAESKAERLLLSGYRLLGYGERPGVPWLLFILMALLATAVGEIGAPLSLSAQDVGRFLVTFANWLLTPVHLLDFTDTMPVPGGLSRELGIVLRVAVAVPFVTAVLALRKYAKQRDLQSE